MLLLEALAEVDEEIMERYLADEPVNPEMMKRALRRGTISLALVPVLCGSAFKNKGIQPLLDAVVEYLPSPLDIPPVHGLDPKGEVVERAAADDAPLAALAFKLVSDPYVGHLTFIRVYSGVLSSGSAVLNATKGVKERLGRLLKMHANKREEIEAAYAGDIVAAVGLKSTTTGDTLADEREPVILETLHIPQPVIDIAIEPATKADQDKLGQALGRIAAEDPSFRLHTDVETGETIISGMGELHLEIIVDRLMREFKVDARVGKPQVAYRETVTEEARAEGKFVRQSGGRGQYGHVVLVVKPLPAGEGVVFANKIVGGAIPKEFIGPTEKGIREAAATGILGYPMVDLEIDLVDGSYHEVDSSERSFFIAGSMGFKEAAKRARPGAAGAHHGSGSGGAGRFCRRSDGRIELPAGPHHRDGIPGLDPNRSRPGASGHHVRLRHGLAQFHPGPGHLHHAIRSLRTRLRFPGGGDFGPASSPGMMTPYV